MNSSFYNELKSENLFLLLDSNFLTNVYQNVFMDDKETEIYIIMYSWMTKKHKFGPQIT